VWVELSGRSSAWWTGGAALVAGATGAALISMVCNLTIGKKGYEEAEERMQKFDVRPANPRLKTANFSGGNQQKIVLAREMERNPDVLIVGQPTRGVDIGAIEFIHRQLVALRDAGCAILVVSVELDEVMSLADRIVVMCAGRIVGEVAAAEADEKMLGLMMANIGREEAA